MKLSETLETERCILRATGLSDAPDLLACVTGPKFPEYLPWASATTLNSVCARIMSLEKKRSEQRAYAFCVRVRDNGGFIGHITLSQDSEPESYSLAYMILPRLWNQGFATECAQVMVRFAFNELGAQRIWAGVAIENQASLRVIQHLGFRHFRSNPHGYSIQGRWIATEEYETFSSPE